MVLEIILIIISIVLSAFFSSSEAAFLSIQKTKIFHMVNNKKKGADLVAQLLENKDKLISTIVVGNAIVNIGFAALLSALFFKITADEIQTAFLTTLVGTIILVIFGDVLPKAIAVRLSESITIIYSRPLRFLEIVFAPILYLLTLIYKGIDNTKAGVRTDYKSELDSWLHSFTPAINYYYKNILKFETDVKYNMFGPVRPWDRSNDNTGENLRLAMAQNPYLHTMIQSGYYDGATQYFDAKYTMWRLDPSGRMKDRLVFKGYRSGHMMYLRKDDLKKSNEDIRAFIRYSTPKKGEPAKY